MIEQQHQPVRLGDLTGLSIVAGQCLVRAL